MFFGLTNMRNKQIMFFFINMIKKTKHTGVENGSKTIVGKENQAI